MITANIRTDLDFDDKWEIPFDQINTVWLTKEDFETPAVVRPFHGDSYCLITLADGRQGLCESVDLEFTTTDEVEES